MSGRIGIVGGGISGLAAAYYGLKKGLEVDLFEAAGELGGLAASFDFGGRSVEKFYHFICGADDDLIGLAGELGLAGEIQFRPARTAAFTDGRLYPFSSPLDILRFAPIPFSARVRFGFNALSSKLRKRWDDLDATTARDWLIGKVGRRAFDVIWSPLLDIKFRDQSDRVSAAWIWHRIHRQASSRKTPWSRENYGFFKDGTSSFIARLEAEILSRGGRIHLGAEVARINRAPGELQAILASGKKAAFGKMIMAVPLPVAAGLVERFNPAYAEKLNSIGFLGVACALFRLKKRVSDAFWLNIHDPRIPVNGFIEYTNLNPDGGPGGDKLVYVPLYLRTSDPWYSKDAAGLRSELFQVLRVVNPALTGDDVVDFRVFRSPYAQAICPTGFKDRVLPVKTPVPDLYLLDSTQLYPSDRVLSALIGLARKTIDEDF
jgi:protoporphyrinogen oxidase